MNKSQTGRKQHTNKISETGGPEKQQNPTHPSQGHTQREEQWELLEIVVTHPVGCWRSWMSPMNRCESQSSLPAACHFSLQVTCLATSPWLWPYWPRRQTTLEAGCVIWGESQAHAQGIYIWLGYVPIIPYIIRYVLEVLVVFCWVLMEKGEEWVLQAKFSMNEQCRLWMGHMLELIYLAAQPPKDTLWSFITSLYKPLSSKKEGL